MQKVFFSLVGKNIQKLINLTNFTNIKHINQGVAVNANTSKTVRVIRSLASVISRNGKILIAYHC